MEKFSVLVIEGGAWGREVVRWAVVGPGALMLKVGQKVRLPLCFKRIIFKNFGKRQVYAPAEIAEVLERGVALQFVRSRRLARVSAAVALHTPAAVLKVQKAVPSGVAVEDICSEEELRLAHGLYMRKCWGRQQPPVASAIDCVSLLFEEKAPPLVCM